MNRAPTKDQRSRNQGPTWGEIVRVFKAVSTRLIRLNGLTDFAWQRNYYEHVIRNDVVLTKIRDYIVQNPRLWEKDQLHPDNPSRW